VFLQLLFLSFTLCLIHGWPLGGLRLRRHAGHFSRGPSTVVHSSRSPGEEEDPFDREIEDKFAFTGDLLCISLYAYTQSLVDFSVKSLDLDDSGDPERILNSGFTGIVEAMHEPFLNHPSRTLVVCGVVWTVAGLFTNAFRREESRQSSDMALILSVRTWLVFATLLLGFLNLNHVVITSTDAVFVGGLLSVMSVWRFLFSGLSPFLP
jgi:hypothetical protein